MKLSKLITPKRFFCAFYVAVAIGEFILMIKNTEIAFVSLLIMFILCGIDALFSFIFHWNDKWYNLAFTLLYLVMLLLNLLILAASYN